MKDFLKRILGILIDLYTVIFAAVLIGGFLWVWFGLWLGYIMPFVAKHSPDSHWVKLPIYIALIVPALLPLYLLYEKGLSIIAELRRQEYLWLRREGRADYQLERQKRQARGQRRSDDWQDPGLGNE